MEPISDSSQIPEAGQAKCYLLSLPPELRELIFSIVVVSDQSLWYDRWRLYGMHKGPTIARTCHQHRQEVVPLYYKLNTFIFVDIPGRLPFVPTGISQMRHIKIRRLVSGSTISLDWTNELRKYKLTFHLAQWPSSLKTTEAEAWSEAGRRRIQRWVDDYPISGSTSLTKNTFGQLMDDIDKLFEKELLGTIRGD